MTIKASENINVPLINNYKLYRKNNIYKFKNEGSEEIRIKKEEINEHINVYLDNFIETKKLDLDYQEELIKEEEEIDKKEIEKKEISEKKQLFLFKIYCFIGISLFTIWNIINNIVYNMENLFNNISINIIFSIISLGAVSFISHKEEN